MDPGTRTALLVAGLFFVGAFTAMNLAIAFQYGFDPLSVGGLLICLLLGIPLIGALFNPPKN